MEYSRAIMNGKFGKMN